MQGVTRLNTSATPVPVQAYRRLALEKHPDKNKKSANAGGFRRLNYNGCSPSLSSCTHTNSCVGSTDWNASHHVVWTCLCASFLLSQMPSAVPCDSTASSTLCWC